MVEDEILAVGTALARRARDIATGAAQPMSPAEIARLAHALLRWQRQLRMAQQPAPSVGRVAVRPRLTVHQGGRASDSTPKAC